MLHDSHSPINELDAKERAIIDLVLSDNGGRMSIGQVANQFNVGKDVVMHAIRMHVAWCDEFRSTMRRNETVQGGV